MAQITLNSSGVASSGSLLLQTNGTTTQATLDTSGNLGLGVTPSAWSLIKAFQLPSGVYLGSYTGSATPNLYLGANNYFNGSNFIYSGSYAATRYEQTQGAHYWYNAASGTAGNAISFTQAMTLDASGNLGVGVTSPSQKLHVEASTSATIRLVATGTQTGHITSDSSGFTFNSLSTAPVIFSTANTERARIDSSGNLLVGTTSLLSGGERLAVKSSAGDWNTILQNNYGSTPYGLLLQYTSAAPNGTSNYFFYADDTSQVRFYVRSNGGIGNFSANNINLSDRREKTNFAPAGDYLAKICAIPVQTFNFIDQNLEEDGGLTLGVVAQDVQAVAPELVTESNWAKEGDEPKMRLSIYQTDLQYALMKCIQEQQAIIETLTNRITALEQA